MKKRVYQAVLAAFVGLSLVFGAIKFAQGVPDRGFLGLASLLFLLAPPLLKRLVGGHAYLLYTEGFAFCILAYAVGCVLQQFDAVPLLDKVSHFLSGFVFTAVGVCLFAWLRRRRPFPLGRPQTAGVAFGVFFSSFVAVVWEICEFLGFVIAGHDSQHHLTTGVFDTMYDLINCFVGSLLCAASLMLYFKKGVKTPSGLVVQDFLSALRPDGGRPAAGEQAGSGVSVRRYRPGDEDRLFALLEREGEPWAGYWRGAGRAQYQNVLAQSVGYLLFEDGTLCGYARCRDDGGYGLYIYDLLVDGAHRGRGYGRMLMEQAARDFAPNAVYVMSDVDPYYEKLGYKRQGSIFAVRPKR